MAVKASGSITLAAVTDVSAVTPYYKAQTSTLSPPSKPTAVPPSGWSATQPTVDTSKTCYIVWLNEYSDGTWGYSDVSVFSEYEAAKAAQATANSALSAVQANEQYFWFTGTGTDAGAHITQVPKDTFQTTPSGGNVLIQSTGMSVRNGLESLAKFMLGGVQIGTDLGQHLTMTNSELNFYAVAPEDGEAAIAKLRFTSDNGDFPVPTYIQASEGTGIEYGANDHVFRTVTSNSVVTPNEHIGAKVHLGVQSLEFYTYTMDSSGEYAPEFLALSVDVNGKVTIGANPTSSMDVATKDYVDSATKDYVDSKKPSFDAPSGVSWSSLSSNWTPSASGIATTRISPSNSSNAYLFIRDNSNSNTIVAQVSTTAGQGQSVTWPVIKGHTYSVGGHSSNVTSMDTRLYAFA